MTELTNRKNSKKEKGFQKRKDLLEKKRKSIEGVHK